MKILSLVIAGFGLSAHAGILAGPVVNPANGHIYYLLSQSTWSDAEAEAVRLGGPLWIGLTDRDKVFTFTWVSGEPLSYTNWGEGQPDNGTGGVEFYAHIW